MKLFFRQKQDDPTHYSSSHQQAVEATQLPVAEAVEAVEPPTAPVEYAIETPASLTPITSHPPVQPKVMDVIAPWEMAQPVQATTTQPELQAQTEQAVAAEQSPVVQPSVLQSYS